MPKFVTALLCKNEKGHYLESVLRRCHQFSDEVLVLDDGSTDGSVELARKLGCGVKRRQETGMWGNEAPARAQLWDWGAKVAGDGWLLICDCDMWLYGDPRPLCLTTQHNAWAFILYDVWNDPRYYRCDGYWQGHKYHRPWLFRPSALTETPAWNARGIHTGHAPLNFPCQAGIAPAEHFYYVHLAYLNPKHRVQKLEQYLAKADLLSPFELAHARSVGD